MVMNKQELGHCLKKLVGDYGLMHHLRELIRD